jgi:hypothetical protein
MKQTSKNPPVIRLSPGPEPIQAMPLDVGSGACERRYYLPDVPWSAMFDDLATGEKRWEAKLPARTSRRDAGPMTVSDYLSISAAEHRHASARVKPTPAMIAWLRANMLHVDHDTIGFQLIEQRERRADDKGIDMDRGDGRFLLIAQHNQIIGSKWLRLFTRDELPPALVAIIDAPP